MGDKKVTIPDQMFQEINEENITEILKQVQETEADLSIDQTFPKEALESLRGKTWADLTNTIIAYSQLLDAEKLLSIHKTLGLMCKVKMLNELKNMADHMKETSTENE